MKSPRDRVLGLLTTSPARENLFGRTICGAG
jgi:hypothetical protein